MANRLAHRTPRRRNSETAHWHPIVLGEHMSLTRCEHPMHAKEVANLRAKALLFGPVDDTTMVCGCVFMMVPVRP